jgi:hypothetical protein
MIWSLRLHNELVRRWSRQTAQVTATRELCHLFDTSTSSGLTMPALPYKSAFSLSSWRHTFFPRAYYSSYPNTMASKQPAKDFLSFVNASPTRKVLSEPRKPTGNPSLTRSSLPCRPVCQGPAGQRWLPRDQGILQSSTILHGFRGWSNTIP